MNAKLEATAASYPFPDCLDFSTDTNTTTYIIDKDGYNMEFSKTNLVPGRAYGATQFMPNNKILGFSNYAVDDYIGALVQLNTNKGYISRAEIEFGYLLELPGT